MLEDNIYIYVCVYIHIHKFTYTSADLRGARRCKMKLSVLGLQPEVLTG